MREIFSVWKSPKMIAAMMFTAFLYAAMTIPFKGLILVPQISEIRPSAFLPALAGIVFGPAGAWGAAIGNLIGDVFGTLSSSSLFGFIANLGLGLIPYRLWYHLFRKNPNQIAPNFRDPKERLFIIVAALIANLFCSMTIGFGVHLLLGRDYTQMWQILMMNNSLFILLLYPTLKVSVYLAEKNELLWYQQKEFRVPVSTPTHQLINLSLIVSLCLGSIVSFGVSKWAELLSVTDQAYELAHNVSIGLTLFFILLSLILIYFDN